ncbi:hypothetical protein CR513_08091, partial [Mucuna pruriens]
MAHGICEGLRMKIILDDLEVKYEGPIKLFCNNSATSLNAKPSRPKSSRPKPGTSRPVQRS